MQVLHRANIGGPCQDCTERHLRCHSECSRYKEWYEKFQKEYQKYRDHKSIENYDAHEAITGKRRNRNYNIWKK